MSGGGLAAVGAEAVGAGVATSGGDGAAAIGVEIGAGSFAGAEVIAGDDGGVASFGGGDSFVAGLLSGFASFAPAFGATTAWLA